MLVQAQAAAKARDWTVGMMAYDQVLAALKGVSASPPLSDRVATKSTDSQEVQGKPEATSAAATDAQKKKRRKARSAETVEVRRMLHHQMSSAGYLVHLRVEKHLFEKEMTHLLAYLLLQQLQKALSAKRMSSVILLSRTQNNQSLH